MNISSTMSWRKNLSKFSIVGESEILSKYGKTITMIVLARINGYYSPYFPQSIMEEEAKCLYGTNFSFAERDFFLNKLLKENPNMSKAAIDQSIAFLERQKEANCPCTIHTQKRGFDWIVFNQLPDRMSSKNDGYQGTDSDETTGYSDTDKDENEEAGVSDPISNHEVMEKVNNQKNENAPEASGTSSETPYICLSYCKVQMQFSTLQYLILPVNYPKTPGMMRQNIPDVRKFPKTTKQRGPENSPLLT